MEETLTSGEDARPVKEQEASPAGERRRKDKSRKAIFVSAAATRRFALKVGKKINESLKDFESLTSLDADVKKELLPAVRKSLLRAVYTREANDRLMTWVENISLVFWFIFTTVVMPNLVVPFAVTPEARAGLDTVQVFFMTIVGFSLTTIVVAVPYTLLHQIFSPGVQAYISFGKIMRWLIFAVAFVCLVVACAFVGAAQRRPLGNGELFLMLTCLAFGTYLGGGALVLGPIVNGARRWLRRSAEKTFTNEYLVTRLLFALVAVEKNQARWADVEFRKLLLTKLENVALCVERVIPGRMRSGNIVTDKWLADSAGEIAAGVRALAKWVITPKKDTRERLLERLAADLTYAVRGEWDGFERTSPEKLSRPELLKSRLLNFVKALASASVPIIVLLLVKRANLVPDGAVLTYLTAGAYIWAALSFLSGLDPQYGAKIAAIKDIAGFLPIPGKGKSE